MSPLLVIGFNQETAHQLTLFLPQATTWDNVDSATELTVRLSQETQVAHVPDILFLEVGDDGCLTQQCQILKQNPATASLPLVCVLTSSNQRELAFAAGATDYLLLPFVPQEVQARLFPYLQPSFYHETFLLTAFNQMNQGVLSLPWLYDNLERLVATTLGRRATFWLWDDTQKCFHQYNQSAAANAPLTTYLNQNPIPTQIETIHIGTPSHPVLLIPIVTPRPIKGVLTVPYEQLPQLTTFQKTSLNLLSQFVAYLLEISHLQEEVQADSTQTALMVLIAKIISEE